MSTWRSLKRRTEDNRALTRLAEQVGLVDHPAVDATGSTSANTNPSRSTTSPTSMGTGLVNIGPTSASRTVRGDR